MSKIMHDPSSFNPGSTRELGNTGVRVSSLCFGTSALGNMPETYGYEVSEEQALQTIRAIIEGPVPFLDTSRNYGLGRSEEMIGRVKRELGGLPKGFVISTKLDRDMETNRFDAERARRSLEESLKTLGLDRVQLLHLHDPEYASDLHDVTGTHGALAELFRMKEEGLAQAVGLAAGNVEVMMPILREWDVDALITHNRFTLTNRNAEKMMDFASGKGIAVLNAAPYASGMLAKGPASGSKYVYMDADEVVLSRVKSIHYICMKYGIPIGAAALQFSMRDERVYSTICGISKLERIAKTLQWAWRDILDSFWDELATIGCDTSEPEPSREYTPG